VHPRRENDETCLNEQSKHNEGHSTVETDETPITPETKERISAAINRSRANWLDLHYLCAKSVCRRAGKCSADPDYCLERVSPRISDDVRQGVDALIQGKIEGLSFDEVLSKTPDAIYALHEWHMTVAQSARNSASARRKKAKNAPPSRHREIQ
jgi:hypothetical protein